MDKKVVLIVILVVAGAILFSTMKSGSADSSTDQLPSRQWVSEDEISLAANAIIGELDEEAMEALPSDLTPNADDLGLMDEEKAELFAILNSVTDSGVLGALGSTIPLGASPMQKFLKTRRDIVHTIKKGQLRKKSLKDKINKTKNSGQKFKLIKMFKKVQGIVSRNQASLKAIDKRIGELKARAKAKGNTKAKTRAVAKPKKASSGGPSKKLYLLISQGKSLSRKYKALQKDEEKVKKLIKQLQVRVKAKNISPKLAQSAGRTLEKKWKVISKGLGSVFKSLRMIEKKIQLEKKRIAMTKKEDAPKARETKKARDKEMAAKKQLKKSEADVAAKERKKKRARVLAKSKALEAERSRAGWGVFQSHELSVKLSYDE